MSYKLFIKSKEVLYKKLKNYGNRRLFKINEI